MKDWKYKYPIKVVRVVDGDTVDVNFDLGFNIFMQKRVIMSGYDAPDLWRPENETIEKEAENCKAVLESILNDYKDELFILTDKDKEGVFGRVVGEIFFITENGNSISVNMRMKEFIDSKQYKLGLDEVEGDIQTNI